MKILAVDTSTFTGSVALVDGQGVAAEWTLRSSRTHNRRLLGTVDAILKEAGWTLEAVGGFAVTSGPGSFTGLRIGLTTVKTLAWITAKPFAAVCSLEALAAPLAFSSMPVCALLDARKQEIYGAVYQPDGKGRLVLRGDLLLLPPERLTDHIQTPTLFCGDGWLLYRDLLAERLGPRAVGASAPFHEIRAGFVGEQARRRFSRQGADNPLTSAPLYVRPSEAEINYPHLANPFFTPDQA